MELNRSKLKLNSSVRAADPPTAIKQSKWKKRVTDELSRQRTWGPARAREWVRGNSEYAPHITCEGMIYSVGDNGAQYVKGDAHLEFLVIETQK